MGTTTTTTPRVPGVGYKGGSDTDMILALTGEGLYWETGKGKDHCGDIVGVRLGGENLSESTLVRVKPWTDANNKWVSPSTDRNNRFDIEDLTWQWDQEWPNRYRYKTKWLVGISRQLPNQPREYLTDSWKNVDHGKKKDLGKGDFVCGGPNKWH